MAFNSDAWPQDLKVALSAAVTNSIVSSATYAAGYLPLNGTLANLTVAQLPVVGSIDLASTGDLSAINFVITGVTLAGVTISETKAGPNNNSVTSALNTYWRIISIVPSVTSVSALNIGISGSATAITNAGTVTANTPMNITSSTFASATSINLINPSFLGFTPTGNESGNTYTINGVDVNGETFTQTITGANATAFNLNVAVAQVNWISQANAGANNLIAGNISQTYSRWCYHSKSQEGFNVEMGVKVPSGVTANYTVQHALISETLGDLEIIENDDYLINKTADGSTFLFYEPYDASRVYINSATAPATIYFIVRPAGLRGAQNPND